MGRSRRCGAWIGNVGGADGALGKYLSFSDPDGNGWVISEAL
jgi:hypothetical protein